MPKNDSHLHEFEAVALQSKLVRITFRVDVPEGHVVLTLISHGPRKEAQVEAGYTFHYGPKYKGPKPVLQARPERSSSSTGQYPDSENYMWRDTSIPNSFGWLAQDWKHGKPDFHSITVATKQPAAQDAELRRLVLGACLEAFGHEALSEEDVAKRAEEMQRKQNELRQQCREWLQNGAAGVKKWNDLTDDQMLIVGKLGQCQFAGCDLAKVSFSNQDLRGSDFRKANLKSAGFGGADCRQADFREANLGSAWLSGGKFLETDFSDADCRKAAFRAADCREAIFAGTDLSGADFSFADLRNVDLSSANLKGAALMCSKYDELTRFPPGFVIGPKLRMEWKGAIPRQPEHRSAVSLAELLALIPAPKNPDSASGNWEEAEAELGIRFPADFKLFIAAYGSGRILTGLELYNPLTSAGRKSIADDLDALQEKRESHEYLWPIHPEKSGMLPWGNDWNGNIFCWLAKGSPDQWPTGSLGHGEDEPVSDNVNVTTFLYNYARNQYPEMQGGQTFEEDDYTFEPL